MTLREVHRLRARSRARSLDSVTTALWTTDQLGNYTGGNLQGDKGFTFINPEYIYANSKTKGKAGFQSEGLGTERNKETLL